MRLTIRPIVLSGMLLVVLLGGMTSAGAQTRIGPNQHFLGLVNGSNSSNAGGVVVYTVCAGPVYQGRMGSVAGGQTMSVAHVKSGGGYTGPLSQVYAWFVPASAAPAPVMLKFTEYGVPQSISTTVQVPCDGTGKAEFSSCPYLAPCVYGFVPDYVNVKFVNIAV